jgi:hypothetical protein
VLNVLEMLLPELFRSPAGFLLNDVNNVLVVFNSASSALFYARFSSRFVAPEKPPKIRFVLQLSFPADLPAARLENAVPSGQGTHQQGKHFPCPLGGHSAESAQTVDNHSLNRDGGPNQCQKWPSTACPFGLPLPSLTNDNAQPASPLPLSIHFRVIFKMPFWIMFVFCVCVLLINQKFVHE